MLPPVSSPPEIQPHPSLLNIWPLPPPQAQVPAARNHFYASDSLDEDIEGTNAIKNSRPESVPIFPDFYLGAHMVKVNISANTR
jgi:hypothetical protein